MVLTCIVAMFIQFAGAATLAVLADGPAEAGTCTPADGYAPLLDLSAVDQERRDATASRPGPRVSPSPAAWYDDRAKRTFIVFLAPPAGSTRSTAAVQVGCYDHATATALRPVVLPTRSAGGSARETALALDEAGHLWILVGYGNAAASELFRSRAPFEIGAFTCESGPRVASPFIRAHDETGLAVVGIGAMGESSPAVFLGRPPGEPWPDARAIAGLGRSHALLAGQYKQKLVVAISAAGTEEAFSTTNLYYLESPDEGTTWQTIRRQPLSLPLQEWENPALAWDYRSSQWSVHLKDLAFDPGGNAVILYLTSRTQPNGQHILHTWTSARWVGREWETTGIIPARGADDPGVLHVERDRSWRMVVADRGRPGRPPTADLVLWSSDDQGRSWYKRALIGDGRAERQAVCRPTHARHEFYTLWAVRHAGDPAAGRLRYIDAHGQVFELPTRMTEPSAQAQPVASASRPAAQE